MVDTEMKVKLIDFGSAQYDEGEATSVYCGSETFTSPQVARDRRYLRVPQEVWACGVLLYVMVTGVNPFGNVVEAEEAILKFPESPKLSEVKMTNIGTAEFVSVYHYKLQSCRDLISSVIVKDLARRASLSEVLGGEWLAAGEDQYPDCVSLKFADGPSQ